LPRPKHRPNQSESTRITKPLFEAGSQCGKRLYLHVHRPAERPEPSAHAEQLVEIGARLVELASGAFPKGEDLGALDLDEAAARTAEILASGRPSVLFHAGFLGGDTGVRVDVVLASAPSELDIFEVKAGTSVKPRHVTDVALQIHTIEAAGHSVRAATLVHLDPKYVHDGSKDYPAQKLFRSVDVTERARRQLDTVREQLSVLHGQMHDEGTLELPTGTWCTNPLPCEFLPRCLEESPEFPLIQLPHLSARLEGRLHEQGIEEIRELDPKRAGLTNQQRRVVRAIHEDRLIVEPFVPAELADIDWPLAIVAMGWHLEVLPRFAETHPWQKLPFAWSIHRLAEDGTVTVASHVSTEAGDPTDATLSALTRALSECGTLMIYEHGLDERLRAMLDARTELKSQLRTLLQLPLFELGNLIQHGVYHPRFRGSFDLGTVHRLLHEVSGGSAATDLESGPELEIDTDEQARDAFARILNSRTRAATREKLGAALEAWVRRAGARTVEVYRVLREPVTES
jgi:hypothetical protein